MSVGGFAEHWVLRHLSLVQVIYLSCLGSGTLYFTSIRKEKGQPFTIRESFAFPCIYSL